MSFNLFDELINICLIEFLPYIDHRNISTLVLNNNTKEIFTDTLLEKYCYHQQPHGIVEKYYQNLVQIKSKKHYKNGYLTRWEEWWKDGKLRFIHNWKNGVKDGLWQGYYYQYPKIQYDVMPEYRHTLKNGKLHGLAEKWYKSGQQLMKHMYIDGKLDGLYEGWYENGQQRYKNTYKNNNLDGISIGWMITGEQDYCRLYDNGILISNFSVVYFNDKIHHFKMCALKNDF